MARLAFFACPLGPLVLTAGGWVRAAQIPVMPWDPALYVIVDYLTGPALRAITWITSSPRRLPTRWGPSSTEESVASFAWESASCWHRTPFRS